MALVEVGDMMYPARWTTGISFSTSMLIDAANEKGGAVFSAPQTGTIDRVCFRSGTVTTPATVDVRLETVDSAGSPSGTLLGTNANAAQLISAANSWYEVTLTAPAAVTAGQLIALVVVNPAVSPGNFTISRIQNPVDPGFPYSVLFTTAWAKSSIATCMALRYDDGTYPYVFGNWPVLGLAGLTLGQSTTPDEVGCRFDMPMACRCAGYWYQPASSATDITVALLDANNVVLGSRTMINVQTVQSNAHIYHRWSSPVDLDAGGVYRLVMQPPAVQNSYGRVVSLASADLMSAMPAGANVIRTHRTNAGAWTDVPTERINLGLWLSAIDAGGTSAVQTARGYVG